MTAQSTRPDSVVSDRVKQLTRGTQWKQVAAIPMGFDTQHPQGMVKIGDDFYLSSVEIKTPTKRFPQPVDGYDRDTGEGVGHLFKFDKSGKLLADLPLGEGTDLSPGRHRLRRALHLGGGRRVPAEQRARSSTASIRPR